MKKQRPGPEAYKFSEVDGYFTMRCHKDRELARQLIEKERRDYEADQTLVVTLEEVKDDRMYYHKACEFYTIGDNWCCECGEQCGTNGRHTFVYYI